MVKENQQDDLILKTELCETVRDFKETLKVQSIINHSRDIFPEDKDILEKMDKVDMLHSFDMEDIDQKRKISKLTKARRTIIFVS